MQEQEISQLRISNERESHMVKSRKNRVVEEERIERDWIQDKIHMENEIKMLNIACESKDRQIAEINEKVKVAELGQMKAVEQMMVKKEKLEEIETLSRNRAHELLQIGQEKRHTS